MSPAGIKEVKYDMRGDPTKLGRVLMSLIGVKEVNRIWRES